MLYKILLEGNPIPWKRPGRSGSRYYDQQHYEKIAVRAHMKEQYPLLPITGAVIVGFTFAFEIPKSVSKKRREMMLKGEILHTQKPDLSNLIKFVEDCGNELLWRDDCQIVSMSLPNKKWSATGFTEITFQEIYPKC